MNSFGVMDMELLNVPVIVNEGDAGTMTAGLKSTFKSYEMIF